MHVLVHSSGGSQCTILYCPACTMRRNTTPLMVMVWEYLMHFHRQWWRGALSLIFKSEIRSPSWVEFNIPPPSYFEMSHSHPSGLKQTHHRRGVEEESLETIYFSLFTISRSLSLLPYLDEPQGRKDKIIHISISVIMSKESLKNPENPVLLTCDDKLISSRFLC